MAASNRFFIPNVEEFFTSVLSVFNQCTICLEMGGDGDEAELLARRMEQYEATLRVMYQRITENRPDQQDLAYDLEQLMAAIRQILERLEDLYCDNSEIGDDEVLTAGADASLSFPTQSGRVGRPPFGITEEQIRALREDVGFRWTDIARILGVSARTLSRRRQSFGMPVGRDGNFSQIADVTLDNLIREILTMAPQSGIGLIRGAIQSRGLRVQRHRIISALQRLDPVMSALTQTRQIIRRTYNVPCPNSLW